MIFKLASLLIFIFQLAHQQGTSCIYTQTVVFSLGPNTTLTPNGNYYSNTLTWTSPQNSITNSMLNRLKFDADLINVISTGGVAIITPLNGTSIISATFTVILFKACSGYIELQRVNYTPTILNLANRTADTQNIAVSLSRNITNNTNNYLVHAMISSFYLGPATGNIQIIITRAPPTLTLNSNIVVLPFFSFAVYHNIYTKVCYTVVLVQILSFNRQLAFYPQINKLGAPFITNLGIPNDFKPYQSQHCIIGLNWVNFNNANSFTIGLIDTGAPPNSSLATNIINMVNFEFDVLCLQNCSANTYIDYTLSNYTCIPCVNRSQFCLQCTSTFSCTKCQPSYYLLSSKAICYTNCPAGYYGDLTAGICIICNSQCITCKDGQACLTCIAGNPVGGICINVQGCTNATIDGPTNQPICLSCHTQLNFVAYNNSCICISGYRIVSQMCINIAGCISTSLQSNAIVCAACNSILKFMLKDNACVCMNGFYMLNGTCTQICGDGKVFTLPCDDGNKIDGDGCSSVCKVEKGFTCKDSSANASSVCSYSGKFSTLSLSTLTNSDVDNQALFIFTVSPPLFNLQQFDLMKNVSLNSSSSLSINSVKYSSGQLSLYVDYSQDIEGSPATFTLNLDSSLFPKTIIQLSFPIKSDGMAFTYGSGSASSVSAASLQSLKQVFLIFTSIVIVVFVASLFVHKMIGVELLMSFQVITLVHSINNNYTKLYSLFHVFSILNANPLYIISFQNNIYTVQQNIVFNQKNQKFSMEVIAGACLLFLCAFGVLNIMNAYFFYKTQLQSNFSAKLPKYISVLYRNCLFPFTIAFFFPFICMLSTHRTQDQSTSFITYFLPFQLMLAAVIFNYEWKYVIIEQSENLFTGVTKSKLKYVPYTLTLMLSMVLLFSLSFHYSFLLTLTAALGLYGFYFIMIIIYRPYQNCRDNLGVFVNCFMVVSFLIWSFLRDRYKSLLSQQNETMAIYAFLGIVSLAIIANIFRVIVEIKNAVTELQKEEQVNKNLLIDKQIYDKSKFYQLLKDQYQLPKHSYKLPSLVNRSTQRLKVRQRLKNDFKKKSIGISKKNLNDLLL